MHKPLGVHYVRTKLYSLLLTRLQAVFDEVRNKIVKDSENPLYRLHAIIDGIVSNSLFKTVQVGHTQTEMQSSFQFNFENKDLKAINPSNIIRYKKVQSNVFEYFKDESPLISHTSRILNDEETRQNNNLNGPGLTQYIVLLLCHPTRLVVLNTSPRGTLI